MGLFDRDSTTKSGLKPKPGPVPMEKRVIGKKEMDAMNRANTAAIAKAKEKS